jgi:hypothetical protein
MNNLSGVVDSMDNAALRDEVTRLYKRAGMAEARLKAMVEAAQRMLQFNDAILNACGKTILAAAAEKEEFPPHPFQPCDKDGEPGHNFTCALLCTICGLPEDRHAAAKDPPA